MPRLSRRQFLGVAAGAGVAVAAGGIGGSVIGSALGSVPSRVLATPSGGTLVDFDGLHQAGIDRPAPPQAATLFAAFDVVATDRAGLAAALREVTRRSRLLASGWSPEASDPLFPPPESGILGSAIGPAGLTLTLSVGASLFDLRFGLADRRPRQLAAMPVFPNDVIDPERAHGDLLLQIAADDPTAILHALRYVHMGVRDSLRLRWLADGFLRPDTAATPGHTTTRNLLGFKDGTANPPAGDATLLDELVWIQPSDQEPAWAVGGSYLVVRIIRMFVERWDRTALGEQEAIIGRTKRTGAPLGMSREEDVPDFTSEPAATSVPIDAHIRLANPRTGGSDRNRIFRRGYSYSRGFDPAGLLDQGLLFACYQRDLESGFMTVQRRLDGEPLEEYIEPVGGGFFLTLPGTVGGDSYLGDQLVG